MSLSTALTVALSGLQASATAAQVISGNISNAQTPGYTEKGVDLAAITTGDSFGGVEVNGFSRVSDSVLMGTYNNATSNASFLSAQSSYLQQVQSALDSSGNPPALSAALSNFQTAWQELSASPEDATQQKAVIAAGQQLASTVDNISSQASALQAQVQSDLGTSVSTLNTDLAKVQQLNVQISGALAAGGSASDLEDTRDQVISDIASITQVQVMTRPNGQVALYTPGGTMLIDGQAQVFTANGDTVVNAAGADMSTVLTGGKMQAQIDFLSSAAGTNGYGQNVVNNLQSQLENFANMFVNTASGGFADTYNSATTNSGEQASSFFTAATGPDGLPDLSTFAVNADLVSGASAVKKAAALPIANTFTATNLAINNSTGTTTSTFSATGLTVNNQTYGGIANAILSTYQQAANALKSSSATASSQQSYYENTLTSETGVNTDTELVNLTNWQNSYAASAHVITTIQSMMTVLEQMVS